MASVTTPSATLTVVVRAINSYMSGVDCHVDLVSTSFGWFCLLTSCYAPPIFASAVMSLAFRIRILLSDWLTCFDRHSAYVLARKRLDKIICLSLHYSLLACLLMLLVASSDYIRRTCNCSVHVITVRDRDLRRRSASRL